MKHLLDNPVYHALVSGNGDLSHGTDDVKYFSPSVSPFVGLKAYSFSNLDTLAGILPGDDRRAIMAPGPVQVPPSWKIFQEISVIQMIHDRGLEEGVDDDGEIRVLGERDVPTMLTLTKLTRPGPFDEETLLFGHYRGFFIEGRLACMAGQRMHPIPYAEISAVCTHPDFRGRGLARRIILDQVKRIRRESEVPFLHVKADNDSAIRLYESLGFVLRKAMKVTILEKVGVHHGPPTPPVHPA